MQEQKKQVEAESERIAREEAQCKAIADDAQVVDDIAYFAKSKQCSEVVQAFLE